MPELKKVTLPPMLIKRIKTLQGLAGVSDEQYRAMLGGYNVESCKDLTILEARAVCDFLQGIVDKIPEKAQFKAAAKAKPYSGLGNRHEDMATEKQLRMLEAMWMQVTFQPNRKAALDAYSVWLKNRFNIGSPEWIVRDKVGAIKRALEAMILQAMKYQQNA